MHINAKRPTGMTSADWTFLEQAPKAVLYAIAKHLAALSCEVGYDAALDSGAYLSRMREEWQALHNCGIVPQKPPKNLPGTEAPAVDPAGKQSNCLTSDQVKAARTLLGTRPSVAPDTQIILDEKLSVEWYAKVMKEMHRTGIQTQEQTSSFCDIAGVTKPKT